MSHHVLVQALELGECFVGKKKKNLFKISKKTFLISELNYLFIFFNLLINMFFVNYLALRVLTSR